MYFVLEKIELLKKIKMSTAVWKLPKMCCSRTFKSSSPREYEGIVYGIKKRS